jgi:hypothetical protein
MSRHVALAAALAAVLGIAGGCGGGGDDGNGLYQLASAKRCLESVDGVHVTTANLDVVASTALGGALRARFPDNEVIVAFGGSLEDAEQTERAYRRFAPKRLRIQDVLHRNANAVLLWGTSPSRHDEAAVRRCLDG